jgi:hypothetical protein
MCDVQLRTWRVWLWSPHGVRSSFPEARDILVWFRVTPHLGHQSRVYMDLLWLWDIWNISVRRMARDGLSKSCLSSLCLGNWGPHTSFSNSLILLYLVSICVGAKVKDSFTMYAWQLHERAHSCDYGVELTPQKLWRFCQIDWVPFKVGWPSKVSLGWETTCRVYQVVTGTPGRPDQFSCIDIWQTLAAHPSWLKKCFKDNFKIIMARVTNTPLLTHWCSEA